MAKTNYERNRVSDARYGGVAGFNVTTSAIAALAAVTIAVLALPGAVPLGTILYFGPGKFAKVATAAIPGATSIAVEALPTALASGDVAPVAAGNPYVKPTTVYYALMISMCTVLGTDGTEVTGPSYGRVAVTNNATNFPASTAGVKSNAAVVAWPMATGSWGVVVGVTIWDALTGGNCQEFAPLQGGSQTIGNGNVFSLPIGAVQFTET